MPPRLSIGLPVFNGADFLPAALESLLGQTFDDFELIISDNGSSDETPEICHQFAARDDRVQFHRVDQNRGAAWNYNHVFSLARGQYFKWASHDDLCQPTFFEQCIQAFEAHPNAVLVYPQTTVIDGAGNVTSQPSDDLDFTNLSVTTRFDQFLKVYRYPRSCNPVFGIYRSQVLAQTPRIAPFIASDMTLLGELTLWGEFIEIPARLFLRRDHAKASVRAYNSYRERIAWFDPSQSGRPQMARWQWLQAYLKAIYRAPISTAEKLVCRYYLLTWMVWNTGGLAKDLIKAGLWPFFQRSNKKDRS